MGCCSMVATFFILLRRICALATFIILIVSFFLPWYYIQYKYTSSNEYNPDKYTSAAYFHPWYIYENVNCISHSGAGCSGQPGTLVKQEGFNLWITFPSEAFGMRVLFVLCWGLCIAEQFLCIYLIIRRNKARFVSYAGFMIMLIATALFVLIRWAFYPCVFPGLDVPTGPCDAFYGSVTLNSTTTFSNGPYISWFAAFLAMVCSGLGLLFSILSPSPDKSFRI